MTFKNRRSEDGEHMKKIMKAAIKEWMDERFAVFGRWTATGIAISVLGLLAWAIVAVNGVPWTK